MKKTGILICFGDSNTYGYDPRSYLGSRYPREVRWTGILDIKSSWEVKNYGLNGRMIPQSGYEIRTAKDAVTKWGGEDGPVWFFVMLGTNDLLADRSPDAKKVVRKMSCFLEELLSLDLVKSGKVKIRLIAPPVMQPGEWVENESQIKQSVFLGEALEAMAKEFREKDRFLAFTNPGEWEIPMAYDGVHFSPEGHRCFAGHMMEILSLSVNNGCT